MNGNDNQISPTTIQSQENMGTRAEEPPVFCDVQFPQQPEQLSPDPLGIMESPQEVTLEGNAENPLISTVPSVLSMEKRETGRNQGCILVPALQIPNSSQG